MVFLKESIKLKGIELGVYTVVASGILIGYIICSYYLLWKKENLKFIRLFYSIKQNILIIFILPFLLTLLITSRDLLISLSFLGISYFLIMWILFIASIGIIIFNCVKRRNDKVRSKKDDKEMSKKINILNNVTIIKWFKNKPLYKENESFFIADENSNTQNDSKKYLQGFK